MAANTSAQTIRKPAAAAYIGPGAYSTSGLDVFSFTSNQAALAQMKNTSVGVYGERRYMLKELSFYNLAVTLPTTSGNFGFKGAYFGSSDYNESQAALAYGRKLGEKLDVGVQFNYYNIKASGYGNAASVSGDAGIIMRLNDKVKAGIHVSNPVGGKFGKDGEEKLPFIYSAGIGYEGSQHFFISAEIEKEESMPVNVNVAMQYRFADRLFARAGIATGTSLFWMGAGVMINSMRVDATASYHSQLGFTPGLLLIYNFSKAKQETASE